MRRDHPAAPSPGIDSSTFPTNMVWPPCPPTNLVWPLLGFSIPSPPPAVANEDRLLLPTSTTYLYYATFTTLLLYYSTLTTHSYYSIATAVAVADRLLFHFYFYFLLRHLHYFTTLPLYSYY